MNTSRQSRAMSPGTFVGGALLFLFVMAAAGSAPVWFFLFLAIAMACAAASAKHTARALAPAAVRAHRPTMYQTSRRDALMLTPIDARVRSLDPLPPPRHSVHRSRGASTLVVGQKVATLSSPREHSLV